LKLRGLLKDDATAKKLDAVQIQIYQNGAQFDVVDAGTAAKFDMDLPLGYTYDIKFNRTGYVSKIIRFDTRNIPPEDRAGGFLMDLEMKLFAMIEGFNTDILKEPIGKATFNPLENAVEFDFGYTENMQKKIDAEKKRLADLAKDAGKFKEEYDKLMAEGTAKMGETKYQDAMLKFDGALKLFPKDVPAKQAYDAAKAKYDAENAAREADAKYNRLLADGENFIKGKNWVEAKKAFTEATKLKPSEKLPKEKLYEIEQRMKEQELYAKYDKVIAEADSRFTNKDYAIAIDKYKEAQAIIAAEVYPKQQIEKAQAALNAMLADELKKKELEKRYQDLIASGDKNLQSKSYDPSLQAYKEALALKPTEGYPKQKITEIEKILADLAADKSKTDAAEAERQKLEKRYLELIAKADLNFGGQKYDEALVNYREALNVKSTEKYPKDKIEEIEKIKADLLAQKSKAEQDAALAAERERLEKRYRDVIAMADKNFREKNYDNASVNYAEAKALKADETYPQAQLDEIERLKAELRAQKEQANAVAAADSERQRIDNAYNAVILEADGLYKESKQTDANFLNQAKAKYEEALGIKANEKYPKAQITNIVSLINNLAIAADNSAAEEAKRKEAERLALEEEIRREREEKEAIAEENRKRRMEEEEAKRKEQEAALIAAAEAERNKNNFSTADRSREVEVDAYYREAKQIEERAKYEGIKEKKEKHDGFGNQQKDKIENAYAANAAEIEGKKEQLAKAGSLGSGWQQQSVAAQEKKRNQHEENVLAYSDRANARGENNLQRMENKKESLDSVPGKAAVRQRRVDELNNDVKTYEENKRVYESRGSTLTSNRARRVSERKEDVEDAQYQGEKVREEQVARANEKKESVQAFDKDVSSAANVRLENAYQKTENKKERNQGLGEGKEALTEQNIIDAEKKKQFSENLQTDKETEMAEKRYSSRNEMFDLKTGQPKTNEDYIAKEGTENLQEGVTETSYEFGKKKIIERTVKRGNKVDKYSKVVSKSGIYYFKNNESITEQRWIQETLQPNR
jgi:hypothetical protein